MHYYPLNCCDFYKTGHRKQYPEGTRLVVSNLTPRSGKWANIDDKEGVVFFGLQYFIKDFLIETFDKGFFNLPKENVVDWYKRRMDTALGIDSVAVDHIAELHDLGYLPIEIRAVPEGTFVPIGVPCMTIHNTLPEFFWLTNYLETVLSSYIWMPCTSATTAHAYKKLFTDFAEKTGAPLEFVNFQGHDFSFRGMSSLQSSVVSGAAHLTSFVGTDTIPAIDFHERYYGADATLELIGCSVPATEHSVMCMGGEDGELETFRRLITETYPEGIVSIVSDTWDFWRTISQYAKTLRPEIMSRNGKVVFRPDSGNPADIICGTSMSISDSDAVDIEKALKVATTTPASFRHNDKFYELFLSPQGENASLVPVECSPTSEMKGAVEVLWDIFGGTINEKGYKQLDPHVGLIYGDSITFEMAKEILQRLEAKGFASNNIVLGIGSYTYQLTTRDTWGFAVKATYGIVNGEAREIYKKPKTDNGSKNSAVGLLKVMKTPHGNLALQQRVSWESFTAEDNLLQPVFRDGKLLREQTLKDIRELLKCR